MTRHGVANQHAVLLSTDTNTTECVKNQPSLQKSVKEKRSSTDTVTQFFFPKVLSSLFLVLINFTVTLSIVHYGRRAGSLTAAGQRFLHVRTVTTFRPSSLGHASLLAKR